jgi:hypothetical protein
VNQKIEMKIFMKLNYLKSKIEIYQYFLLIRVITKLIKAKSRFIKNRDFLYINLQLFFADKYRSASKAAMQPVPAAVTA